MNDTDWLAACRIGLGVHWTAQTVPQRGAPLPFADAVARFDLPAFLEAVERCGADYVLFTATHALQMLPCPCAALDRVLPGRTASRDLLGELADGLAARGKSLILYYNHSCNQGDDPPWERAVGYHDASKAHLVENLVAIVGELGQRYGPKLRAWWFDSAYSIDPRGPHNTISTEMGDFRFPWATFLAAARQGDAQRLVAVNAGIGETFAYTPDQDFWAGEMVNLDTPPTARFLPDGRQWHGWTCLDDRRWVTTDNGSPSPPPLYADDELARFLAACRRHRAPMTFNIAIFQDGTLAPESIAQLERLATTWARYTVAMASVIDEVRPVTEARLLQRINDAVPLALRERLTQLMQKQQSEALLESEATELRDLVDAVELREAERAELLAELAHRRGVNLLELVESLGLRPRDQAP